MPAWVEKNHADLVPAARVVAGMLRRRCEHSAGAATQSVELELRLGQRRDGQAFDPDVGFDRCDAFLQRCGPRRPGSVVFTEWVEYTDYHSEDADGRRLRTRARYDADECRVVARTVRKQRLERAELSAGKWAVRCDYSREDEIPPGDVPALLHPVAVTCCQRCSASPVCSRWPTPLWRYDFTTRWHGDTLQAVEKQRGENGAAPAYIVELEYVGDAAAVEGLGAVYIAVAGLLQLLDIVSATSAPCHPVST